MRVKSIRYMLSTSIFVILILGLITNTSYAQRGFSVLPPELIMSKIKQFKETQQEEQEQAKKYIEKLEDPEAKRLMEEAGSRFNELADFSEELEKQQEFLQQERDLLENDIDVLKMKRKKLIEEQKTLESEKRFFATGFYSTLFATIIAIFGIILRVPTIRLERRLKRLEILEKEHQLKQNQVPFELEQKGTNLLHSFFNWFKKN